MYTIYIKPSAKKELRKIPKIYRRHIEEKIKNLSDIPRPHGCKKLKGEENYRIRQGNYRVVYSIEDSNLIIEIIKVRHRRFIYRKS